MAVLYGGFWLAVLYDGFCNGQALRSVSCRDATLRDNRAA